MNIYFTIFSLLFEKSEFMLRAESPPRSSLFSPRLTRCFINGAKKGTRLGVLSCKGVRFAKHVCKISLETVTSSAEFRRGYSAGVKREPN